MRILLIVKGFVLAVLFLIVRCNAWAAENTGSSSPQSFTARAIVRTSEFQIGKATPLFTKEADVTFSYSNAWWRIDAVPVLPKPGVLESCMSIPGGTRYIAYPVNPPLTTAGKKPAASATACPMSFPSPGSGAIFNSWLMLCPQPKLPTLNATQIYRPVLIPGCENDILFHTNNLGDYSIVYLNGGGFVSSLRIRNKGWEMELIPTTFGFEPKFRHLPSYVHGYLEFEYKLLSTTNYRGFTFPARAVVKRIAPTFDPQKPNDAFVRVLTEIEVVSLTGFDRFSAKGDLLPHQVVVSDMRFTNLPVNASVSYRTLDTDWKSTSDPKISSIATRIGEKTLEGASIFKSRFLKAILLFIILLPVAVFLKSEYRKHLSTKKCNPKS